MFLLLLQLSHLQADVYCKGELSQLTCYIFYYVLIHKSSNQMNIIFKHLVLLFSTFALAIFSGCSTYEAGTNTREDAARGAVLGGIAGAIIGNQSGNTGEGAAVGAVTGAVLGGMVGSAEDKRVAQARTEQARIRAERRAHDAELREKEAELDIARGYSITDQEVLEAEQRAIAAENELRRKQKERAEAIERQRRIEDAEARARAAQSEAEQLKTY